MLASETASTLPREGAEQQSSAIASKSVACAASSSSSTQRRQSQDCETLLKMPLVRSGQEKCPCAVSGLSFFFCSLSFFATSSSSVRLPLPVDPPARASLLHASLLTVYLPLSVWSPVRVLPLIKIDAHNPLSSCV